MPFLLRQAFMPSNSDEVYLNPLNMTEIGIYRIPYDAPSVFLSTSVPSSSGWSDIGYMQERCLDMFIRGSFGTGIKLQRAVCASAIDDLCR